MKSQTTQRFTSGLHIGISVQSVHQEGKVGLELSNWLHSGMGVHSGQQEGRTRIQQLATQWDESPVSTAGRKDQNLAVGSTVGWESTQYSRKVGLEQLAPQWDGSPLGTAERQDQNLAVGSTVRWESTQYSRKVGLEFSSWLHSGMGVPPAVTPPGEHQFLKLITKSLSITKK